MWHGEVSHEIRFADDRRLTGFVQAATLQQQQIDLVDYEARERTLAGIGVTFWYGIRGLGGLPVIVTYAEGLIAPDNAPESHRREIALVLAAAF